MRCKTVPLLSESGCLCSHQQRAPSVAPSHRPQSSYITTVWHTHSCGGEHPTAYHVNDLCTSNDGLDERRVARAVYQSELKVFIATACSGASSASGEQHV